MGPLGWFIGGMVARDLMGNPQPKKPKPTSEELMEKIRRKAREQEAYEQKLMDDFDKEHDYENEGDEE